MLKRTHSDYLNLLRSQAQNHYRTQKSLQKTKIVEQPTRNPIAIFLSSNVWGWVYHYFKSRVGRKHPFMDYSQSDSNGVFKMVSTRSPGNERMKIVIAADWATDTEESDRIGYLMKAEGGDYTIHLGDVYFVGAPPEVASNFIDAGNSWPVGSSGTLALPGNHEFYSNGNPFFDTLLTRMFVRTKEEGILQQAASFFCLENDYWRIIGLDTGYYSVGRLILEYIFQPDAHLDPRLVEWLKKEVCVADDNRGLVIFSHHQYCSAFEKQYPRAAESLREVFGAKTVLWIWGHEHRFAVYGSYLSKNRWNDKTGIKAYGRCIGHGGMPVEIGKLVGGIEVYTPPNPKLTRGCKLVFWDKRKKAILGNSIVGHNGYAVLKMDTNKLTIEYKDEKCLLFAEEWTVNMDNGDLSGRVIGDPEAGLSLFADSFNDATK